MCKELVKKLLIMEATVETGKNLKMEDDRHQTLKAIIKLLIYKAACGETGGREREREREREKERDFKTVQQRGHRGED